jgi:predicted AAA+ superfamily ATPase
METYNKIFVVDIGLRNTLLGTRRSDIGHDLKNLVYLELLRRGFSVYAGKIDGALCQPGKS